MRGDNNIRGYVKNEDLNPEINTVADHQKYLEDLNANDWKIPLYNQDGKVIGKFEVSESEDVIPNAQNPEIVKNVLAS